MLQLLDELIPNISIYLQLHDINNLIRSGKKFNNALNIDWNRYFRYHLNIDIKLGKNNVIYYSPYFIGYLNSYYFYNYIVQSGPEEDLDYHKYHSRSNKEIVCKRLMTISKFVKKYEHNSLYNQILEKQKPVLFHRLDFIEKFVGWTAAETKKILIKNMGKIIIIENNEIDNDDFWQEALDAMKTFSLKHENEIFIMII